ncbi:MAG: hypothetical protein AUH86_02165 [Acidobacteria bacterium 13_1_40CM_4_58_4]|nr:MAG: hypothetical protein AUH86_02165 [Acidobacteria bacterium 13_1_40CM_4_58_4]
MKPADWVSFIVVHTVFELWAYCANPIPFLQRVCDCVIALVCILCLSPLDAHQEFIKPVKENQS